MISNERITQSEVKPFAIQSLKQRDPGGGNVPDYHQPERSESEVTIPDYKQPDPPYPGAITSVYEKPDRAEAEVPIITPPDY